MRRNRMSEPWGYQDQNNYQGTEIIHENAFESFFAGAEYQKSDNKIHFTNKDGEEIATLDVKDFVTSGQVIEKAWCEDGKLYIKFANGDLVTIDIRELIEENEYTNGLQINDGVVSVLVDPQSERWLTVSENGVKVSGIQAELDGLNEKIVQEKERAETAEAELSDRIDHITSGDSPLLQALIERLGYKDNDTLQLTNEHEVAFGEYNVSNTDSEPSGQTIFSIGFGTSDDDRKNAIEVRKDGTVYMWVENDYMNINYLLGQIAHETYDTDEG